MYNFVTINTDAESFEIPFRLIQIGAATYLRAIRFSMMKPVMNFEGDYVKTDFLNVFKGIAETAEQIILADFMLIELKQVDLLEGLKVMDFSIRQPAFAKSFAKTVDMEIEFGMPVTDPIHPAMFTDATFGIVGPDHPIVNQIRALDAFEYPHRELVISWITGQQTYDNTADFQLNHRILKAFTEKGEVLGSPSMPICFF